MAGAAALAATSATSGIPTATAQEASPIAAGTPPGFGITRVRVLPTPELAQAIFPDAMTRFLPRTREIPGYRGYAFAFVNDDPAAQITMTLLDDAAAAETAGAVAEEYVGGLDPRLTPDTPFADQGPIRVYRQTERSSADIPPLLHGCQITIRHRTNAPDVNVDALVTLVQNDLAPSLQAMEGFVLYAWIEVEGGRVAVNIWETAAQLEAGNDAVAAYVAANTSKTTIGDPEVYSGTIAYSDILETA